ncbi:MAG: class I SAM-dependent methyltransferase [Proteobacteria bacterium]|nr:class I SAM-dependent methyltransferase [Pseudomonadota bacterium]
MAVTRRGADGSAGDFDYSEAAAAYRRFRRADPRIAATLHAALGDARTVLNVGAGAGSYEPVDRDVTAVEPSAAMRAQRPAHLARAIDALAEALPFPDRHFDAAMASFTVHQWQDLARGLGELRRVTRGPVVVMTTDPQRMGDWWLAEYCPEVLAIETRRCPAVATLAAGLGGDITVMQVPIPLACTDGFNDAYYGRPERLLDRDARLACSSWGFVGAESVARFEHTLARDLADGTWDARHGHLRQRAEYVGALVLVVSTPADMDRG